MEFNEEQISSQIVLDNGVIMTMCDNCRIMYSERNPPQDPPCDTCKVDPIEENEDAYKIFYMIRHQLIVSGMGSIIDVNHMPIHEALRLYRIKDKKRTFEKILTLCRWWINRINKKETD